MPHRSAFGRVSALLLCSVILARLTPFHPTGPLSTCRGAEPVAQRAKRPAPPPRKKAGPSAITLTPPAPFAPLVALSQQHRDLCEVVVGDGLPAFTLPDLTGAPHTLDSLRSPKLTVVLLWDAEQRYAVDQFRHLATEVVAPFAPAGVAVVAIHVGSKSAAVESLCTDHGRGVTCLLDADRNYFHQVAKDKLPRTYLLDAQGRIVWFDLEYSRTTRFDLRNALRWFLQPPAAQP